jgi:hypothetical protein
VPAVKNALYDRLAARAGLAGVLVSYGPPFPKPGREFVWVADGPSTDYTQEQIGAGPAPHQRKEDYVLEVFCRVIREGGQQQECTERAYALAAEVEAEIANDDRINNTISAGGRAEVTGGGLAEAADDMKRGADVLVRIHCETFIGP